MKRWLLAAALLWIVWIAGLFAVNPSWPLARRIYVAGWQQLQAWGLDPCRSCPPPNRFH